jgi:hypothetical protein
MPTSRATSSMSPAAIGDPARMALHTSTTPGDGGITFERITEAERTA